MRPLPRRDFLELSLTVAGALVLPDFSSRPPQDAAVEVVVLRDIRIPMRDGVPLATDVYIPARNGAVVAQRFPVILERTPYDKTADSRSERTPAVATPKSRAEVAEFFVRRGYVVIYQDCRGRYRSGGEFVKYLSDGNDGFDTCAWIVEQSWCNGRIGTMGLSYAAHTQGALGSAGAPGVAAMFLDSGGFSNAYQGGIRQGGAFELKQATWAFTQALESREIEGDPARLAAMKSIDIREWFSRMPWRRGHSPVSLAPEYERYLFDQWEHGVFDGFWKQLGIYAAGFYDQFSDAAMVHMSSWYDPYPRTATDNYVGLSKRKRGPVRLILGPWTHGDRQLTYAGDVDFGPRATLDGNLAPDFLTLRLRWFDKWLRGIDNGVDREPAVRLFVMGGGSGRRNPAGRMEHGGAWRTRPLAERADVLVFQTPPLDEDVEVTGPITVNLWISSSAPDTDFTAKLIDIYPPNPDYPEGYAMNLTDGILRVRYRSSWEKPALMVPGRIYPIKIEAFPTSNRFTRGHRIRLDISSSNFPHFDANPNTGEPEGRARGSRIATNRVYMDANRPSHVVLPVIPRRA